MGEIVKLSLRQGTKRKFLQSPKKGKEGREPKIRVIKPKPMPKPTTASTLSPSISPEQHLQAALESLKQAYIGLEEEEKKRTSQRTREVRLVYPIRRKSFYKGERKQGSRCPKRTSRRSKNSL